MFNDTKLDNAGFEVSTIANLSEAKSKKLVKFLKAVEKDKELITYGALAGFMEGLTGTVIGGQARYSYWPNQLPANLQYLIVSKSTLVPGRGYKGPRPNTFGWKPCDSAVAISVAFVNFK
jgi:hypothetical protein